MLMSDLTSLNSLTLDGDKNDQSEHSLLRKYWFVSSHHNHFELKLADVFPFKIQFFVNFKHLSIFTQKS